MLFSERTSKHQKNERRVSFKSKQQTNKKQQEAKKTKGTQKKAIKNQIKLNKEEREIFLGFCNLTAHILATSSFIAQYFFSTLFS